MTAAPSQRVITCQSCESVFRLSEVGKTCPNCGAPLETSDWLRAPGEPKYVGVGSWLKPVADMVTKAYEGTNLLADEGDTSMAERVEGPVMCGWCHEKYPSRPDSPNCHRCGGVLPKPPGADPGPPPPSPPRKLPGQFLRHLYGKQNFGGWTGVGLIVVGIPASLLLIGIPMILLGIILAWSNFATARSRHVALAQGVAVPGEIEKVVRYGKKSDEAYSHIYQVWFRFDADGRPWRAMKYTYDASITKHFTGEPVWVVTMPGKPGKYDIWPPLA